MQVVDDQPMILIVACCSKVLLGRGEGNSPDRVSQVFSYREFAFQCPVLHLFCVPNDNRRISSRLASYYSVSNCIQACDIVFMFIQKDLVVLGASRLTRGKHDP